MSVGRFQVMALVQAARAFELGLPLESALSWGLTKAIFYAAAKRGFKGHAAPSGTSGAPTGRPVRGGAPKAETREEYYLGDDMAYKAQKGRKVQFMIGGKVQTKEDFQRQIEARFEGHFEEAWREALDYVRHFPRETLLSANGFFADVYRPKRDEFAEKWSEMTRSSAAALPQTGRVRQRKRASEP
jgi:hypothetical protein